MVCFIKKKKKEEKLERKCSLYIYVCVNGDEYETPSKICDESQ